MKKILILSILGFIAAVAPASASTLLMCADQTADATGVGGATLDQYILLNSNIQPGCKIDNLLFTNFAYNYSVTGTGLGTPQNSSAVQVALNAVDDQFQFGAFWLVTNTQQATLELSFTVTATTGDLVASLQNGFTASQAGALNGGPTNTTKATCAGGTCGFLTTFTNAIVTITPTSAGLNIVNSVVMAANGGSAFDNRNRYQVSIVSDQFDPIPPPVPEPVTSLLMGSSLVGLGLVARKRRRA